MSTYLAFLIFLEKERLGSVIPALNDFPIVSIPSNERCVLHCNDEM